MTRSYNRRRAAAEPAELLRERLVELEPSRLEGPPHFPEWAQGLPEPKSGTLDFGRFPFQRELYESRSDDRELVIKRRPGGVSAYCIRWPCTGRAAA